MLGKFFLSNCLNICGLLFLIYITITYLSKKKFNEVNHKIYRLILICLYTMIISHYAIYFFIDNSSIIIRLFLILFTIFGSLIGLYFFTTFDVNNDSNKLKKVMTINSIFTLVLCVAVCFIKYDFINDDTYSVSSIFQYLIMIYIAIILIRILIKHKDKTSKMQKLLIGYVFFSFVLFLVLKLFIHIPYDYLVYWCTLITILIYFSYESQAYILSHDLEKSKKELIEATNKKNNFLYGVSNEIRVPISNIISNSEEINSENINGEELNQKINNIKNNILDLSNFINMVNSSSFGINDNDGNEGVKNE